jgi:hypothetical protein
MIELRMLAVAAALLGAVAHVPVQAQQAGQDSAQKAPEIGTAYADKAGWAARKYMVGRRANPLAVEAGYQMLGGRRGDRLGHRDPAGADPGRAAIVRHRRRRLPDALRRQARASLRRPRKRARGGRRTAVPESRRQRAVARGRRRRRALGRRPGRAAHARDGAQAARQAAVENPVRPGDRALRARLPGQPAPQRPADVGPASQERSGRRQLFLRCPRPAVADRPYPEKPGAGQDLARDRSRRRRRLLQRPHRARHRRQGGGASDQSGQAHCARHCRLPGETAPAGVQRHRA